MHANLEAFTAVLKDMKTRDYDAVIYLGDAVGYYTQPEEVVNLVREVVDYGIMGNHDWAACDLNNPLYKIAREDAQAALRFNNPLISDENKKWLLSLPLKAILETPYGSLTLVHGHPVTIFDYIYGETQKLFDLSIQNALNAVNTDFLLIGHSHIQGIYTGINRKIYVNPGAIGQPRDNDNRAAYAILDIEKKEAELLRIEYDYASVIKKIRAHNLPESIGTRLKFGL